MFNWRAHLKVAAVYTSTTPELVEMVESELKAQFSEDNLEIISLKNPDILQEARDAGGVTPHCARELINLYEEAARSGAEIIFNICSSIGDVAALAKPLYESCGVSFVRIDEDMARAAVKAGRRIGVIATLRTTLEPTKRLIQACADEAAVKVELVDALAEGAFGLDQEQFKKKLIETGRRVKEKADILVFAQGSMAYAAKDVSEALGLPVFSSVAYGAKAVKAAADKRAWGKEKSA
jgi:aspartate/glutamate racemase